MKDINDSQKAMAELLVDEISVFGVRTDDEDEDGGEALTPLMLLDALACAGLALYQCQAENPASREFMEAAAGKERVDKDLGS